MISEFCQSCQRVTGHKRALGWGTFFAVVLTGGSWLLAIPFYQPRCVICGTVVSESASVARRSKTVALLLSAVFPGLGQLYNRQPIKGAAFLIASLVLFWLLGRAVPGDLEALLSASIATDLLVPLGLLLVTSLWSIVDAWWAAGR